MTALTSTEGQTGLPRYFGRALKAVQGATTEGRLDFVLEDGRRFRIEGRRPGPVAELVIHNDDLFARLIREGDLGFCEAYVEGWWDSPDLMGFMDFIQTPANSMLDTFPGFKLVQAFERLRHWLNSNSKTQARKNIAHHYDLGNDFYRLWLDDSMT